MSLRRSTIRRLRGTNRGQEDREDENEISVTVFSYKKFQTDVVHVLPLQSKLIVGVVDGEGDWIGYGPLVPHILPVVDAPEEKLNLISLADTNGRRHQEEDREHQC